MHVMLDLETMSTRANAAITAIGAVKFDPWATDTPETIADASSRRFHCVVDLEGQRELGRDIDTNTLYWWMQQSAEARNAICAPDKKDLRASLVWFREFAHGADKIWGYGAAFDNAVIGDAFRAVGLTNPVNYRGQFCMRTIAGLAEGVSAPRVGVAHNALDDAINQVFHLQAAFKQLAIPKAA